MGWPVIQVNPEGVKGGGGLINKVFGNGTIGKIFTLYQNPLLIKVTS